MWAMSSPDYYDLDALLTAEERLTRDTVRAFVEHECLPLLEGCFSRDSGRTGPWL